MKRVLIIGGNGAGKSTMAKELAEITSLPLCHLDGLYWLDGWVPRPRDEFDLLLTAELEKSEWILDGVFAVPYHDASNTVIPWSTLITRVSGAFSAFSGAFLPTADVHALTWVASASSASTPAR